MRARGGPWICLFACELNPPYAIGPNLWAPGPISGFADFWHFSLFDDMNTGWTFVLHDALRVMPSWRGKHIGLGEYRKCYEASGGGLSLERRVMSAGGKADDGEGQSASPEDHPDA